MKYQLFVDLDGVMADLDKKVLEITGKYPTLSLKPNNKWKVKDRTKMWDKINEYVDDGNEFWTNLELCEGAKTLWNSIKHLEPNILSAKNKITPGKKSEKITWVKQNLDNHGTIIIVNDGTEKQKYAKNTAILIDDMPKNIEEWQNAKGIGILHSSPIKTLIELSKLNII